jgi:hypothetical protein
MQKQPNRPTACGQRPFSLGLLFYANGKRFSNSFKSKKSRMPDPVTKAQSHLLPGFPVFMMPISFHVPTATQRTLIKNKMVPIVFPLSPSYYLMGIGEKKSLSGLPDRKKNH